MDGLQAHRERACASWCAALARTAATSRAATARRLLLRLGLSVDLREFQLVQLLGIGDVLRVLL